MTLAERRRAMVRTIRLDRSLEGLPLFRLSDSAEEGAVVWEDGEGARWRVLPAPGDRLPGTFDQDVYVELMHRWHDAGSPDDGVVHFTLHDFLRSMGRRADGRTYELLRSALARLERTILESQQAYYDAANATRLDGRFTILTSIVIDRRRAGDRDQFSLFPALPAGEPGDARVTIGPMIRGNITAGHHVTLNVQQYKQLSSPVARRIYRLLELVREQGEAQWRLPLEKLAALLPLTQRYPSHLSRVLQPAHEMLLTAGLVKAATIRQVKRVWVAEYAVIPRTLGV
ncbi:MAG: replication initiator protein A [Gemmatimonadetes bacterium]|nr:replication initiator protein A [Gemmatimonadota bacterium]